jgi:hypothetical protein
LSKFYLQVNDGGIITDAIDYPYGDYIEHETDALPTGVLCGWFKFENGAIVEHLELKPAEPTTLEQLQQENLALQDRVNCLENALNDIILGGM